MGTTQCAEGVHEWWTLAWGSGCWPHGVWRAGAARRGWWLAGSGDSRPRRPWLDWTGLATGRGVSVGLLSACCWNRWHRGGWWAVGVPGAERWTWLASGAVQQDKRSEPGANPPHGVALAAKQNRYPFAWNVAPRSLARGVFLATDQAALRVLALPHALDPSFSMIVTSLRRLGPCPALFPFAPQQPA